MTHPEDEFYIGYETAIPPGVWRSVRAWVTAASVMAVAMAAFVTMAQRPLADSSFAYGQTQAWSGYLVLTPAPALLVPNELGFTRYWLVGRGKHGAADALAGLGDAWTEVSGTEIARDPWRMVEVASARPGARPVDAPDRPSLDEGEGRTVSLRGEIVDSKCFLGVMNPGERTVHRDCAARCLSGGVTPMFSFRDGSGSPQLAVLVDAMGAVPPARTRNTLGRLVELTGRLFTVGDVLVLQLDSTPGA